MRYVYKGASRLFGCLALALLAFNLLLAPPRMAFADTATDPVAVTANCPSGTQCSTGCIKPGCLILNCDPNQVGCGCAYNQYDPKCSTNCACWMIGSGCECGPK